MFSKLQIASAFAVFATATAAIPADVSCGYTGNGFCLSCPVDETLSVINSGGSTNCTCTKAKECKVFTLDGKPSTLEAFNQATYVPGDGFTAEDDEIDENEDYDDYVEKEPYDDEVEENEDYDDYDIENDDGIDIGESLDDLTAQVDNAEEDLDKLPDGLGSIDALVNDAKEACWNAAPAGVDKSTQINISGSQCNSGGKTWSMSKADAAKFDAITSSITTSETEDISSSSSSSATTESTTESTTSSAQMAAFAFAPLCVLLAMA